MNETTLYYIFFAVIAVVVVGVTIFRNKKDTMESEKILNSLASKRNGVLKKTVSDNYYVSIIQDGIEIKVSLFFSIAGDGVYVSGVPRCTVFECSLPINKDIEFQIATKGKGILDKNPKKGEIQISQFNNPEFDKTFMVRSNDAVLVKSLLTDKAQAELLKLNSYQVWIIFKNKELKFHVLKILREEEQLDTFIDTAGLFLEQIKKALI